MSASSERYVLYGSFASYATAKSRCYLRKKGIPFIERLPSHPRFREHVRPTNESHRIPQLEAPDGEVVQDTVAMFDYLEARFPEPAAWPAGPRQQLAARLFELLFDAELGRVAWHYRWNFMDENYGFVGREFGRSFRPQGSDEELDHYGRVIADRMEGKRAGIGVAREHFAALEAVYFDVLARLEAHFTTTPYLFGGRPSQADFSLMGPLFGHLARDPLPAQLMKQRAPRVFRWTEHMNTPEIQSPEFPDVEEAFFADDEIPETTLELLRICIADCGAAFVETARLFNEWAAQNPERAAGALVSDQDIDEPTVGRFETEIRGVPLRSHAGVYPLWVWQRSLDWLAGLGTSERAACEKLMAEVGGSPLVEMDLGRRLARVRNRIALG